MSSISDRLMPKDASWDELILIGGRIAIILAALFAGWMLYRGALRILAHFDRTVQTTFPSYLTPRIGGALKWFMIGCAVNFAFYAIALPAPWEERAHRLLEVVIIIAVGGMLMGLTLAGSEWLKHRYSGARLETLEYRSMNTRLGVFTNVIVFLVWMFTGITIIMTIPHLRSIGVSLFASAGVAGIVIGMAAGPTLSNLIAGIQIALTQPIRIGDQITVGNVAGIVGQASGVIEEIDSTYVVVRLWDLRRLIVPLNYFIQNQFQNWTHTQNAMSIGRASIFVDYTIPIEPVRQELIKMVKAIPLWDGNVCALDVVDITNGKVAELRASFSTQFAGDVFKFQCQVREALLGFVRGLSAPHA